MKICLVSREYPLETGWGGIGNYTYNLAHGLASLGCEVHVIAQSLDIDKDYLDEDVHIHRVAHKTIIPYKGKLREFCLRLEYSQSVYKKIKEVINKFKIEIIEAPNFSAEGFVYSLFKKAPLITRLHTHFSEVIEFMHWKKNLDRRLSCWLEDAAILRSNLITCSTRAHAENIFREIGLQKRLLEIIPLGTKLPQLKSVAKPDNNNIVILFVGRLEERKGVHILIKAIPYILETYPNAIFNIIGRDTFVNDGEVSFVGDKKQSFREKLIDNLPERYKKNVNFLGYIEPGHLGRYYEECDIFVAPSLYESFGFIYIEAMSYAKPVIGCAVGGVTEVIDNGISGVLVPPGEPVSLADNILKLISDKELRFELGKKARERVENNFTNLKMAEKTLDIYEKVAKRTYKLATKGPNFKVC